MPMTTFEPHRLRRADWTVLVALVVFAILAGFWPLTGVLLTVAPVFFVPAAAGLPNLIPTLRLTPLGETTWGFWAADIAGVLLMLATADVMLRAPKRRAAAGPGRAFGRGLWVTIVAIVAGNIVRGVYISFVVHADIGTYLGQLAGNVVVSTIFGTMIGIVIGALAALAAIGGRAKATLDPDTAVSESLPANV